MNGVELHDAPTVPDADRAARIRTQVHAAGLDEETRSRQRENCGPHTGESGSAPSARGRD